MPIEGPRLRIRKASRKTFSYLVKYVIFIHGLNKMAKGNEKSKNQTFFRDHIFFGFVFFAILSSALCLILIYYIFLNQEKGYPDFIDLLQLAISTVGLIVLIQTLSLQRKELEETREVLKDTADSQKKTATLQNRQTEFIRKEREMASYTYCTFSESKEDVEPPHKKVFTFFLIINKNPCCPSSIKCPLNENVGFLPFYNNEIIKENDRISIKGYLKNGDSYKTLKDSFILRFSDIQGNDYSQEISLDMGFITIKRPKLLFPKYLPERNL
jgi:hypothetical protein